jgi:hypothetical protein
MHPVKSLRFGSAGSRIGFRRLERRRRLRRWRHYPVTSSETARRDSNFHLRIRRDSKTTSTVTAKPTFFGNTPMAELQFA